MTDIIIVEDENIVRLGISSLIDWETQGFCIRGLFKNGREALSFLEKNKDIDIVITDIRMPVMGGEELVANIRKFSDSIDILVLSNYDDFEIVKNCFKMGISDYLLKQEIEPENFLELLLQIVRKRQKKPAPKEIREDSALQIFLELKNCGWSTDDLDIQKKYKDSLPKFKEKYFVLATYILTDEKEKRIYEGQRIQFSIIQECIRENTMEYFEDLVILKDKDRYLAVLWSDRDQEENKKKIVLWSQRLETVIQEYFNLTWRAGISDVACGLNELKAAYAQALYRWKMLFYYPQDPVIFSDQGRKEFRQQDYFFGCLKEVRFCLEFNNFSVLQSSLEKFYDALKREKDVEPENVLRFTDNLFTEINYFLIENTKAKLDDLGFEWFKTGEVYFHIDALRDEVLSTIEKVLEYMKSNEIHYEFIARVKWLISKKYAQEISLQELADILSINPGYLSSLFKKKTGVSFVQYLTNYRIKKAVELLKSTNFSVEEIAEQVGYPNSNYFVKVFKKTVGMTISEFRKNGI